MPLGVVGWLQKNVISIVGVILLASMAIGATAYVMGAEKTTRFFLAAAYLTGGGHAVLSETPREYTQGYHDMKIVASSQVYDPTTKKFVTVRPQEEGADDTSIVQSDADKAAAKKAREKALASLPEDSPSPKPSSTAKAKQ